MDEREFLFNEYLLVRANPTVDDIYSTFVSAGIPARAVRELIPALMSINVPHDMQWHVTCTAEIDMESLLVWESYQTWTMRAYPFGGVMQFSTIVHFVGTI